MSLRFSIRLVDTTGVFRIRSELDEVTVKLMTEITDYSRGVIPLVG